ncbi:hypothetical protein EGW08_014383 [Elysia chlorotica]|uniref:Mitochondrial fission process protein 1 n=1 Tax=Elysia chlorotica TaxID=188477 RepID=A0A433T8N6_ELYCH|nr:hypothetical protein EGW08_014383 [Elysia chlorotica]
MQCTMMLPSKVPDPFLEQPLRSLGYGIAVGVAIRYRFCHDLVLSCNAVAGGFIIGHAIHRGFNLNKSDMMIGMVDALINDSLASVLIPTFVTYTVCGSTRECLRNLSGVPKGIYKWAPLTLGLCLLPIMMPPIDRGVCWFMNETVRTLY